MRAVWRAVAWLGRASALAAVVSAGVSLGLQKLVWEDRTGRLEQRLGQLRGDVHRSEMTAARLDAFQEELQRQEARLETSARGLPAAGLGPLHVAALAAARGVSVTSLEGGAIPAAEDPIHRLPFRLVATGERRLLARVLDDLVWAAWLEVESAVFATGESGDHELRLEAVSHGWVESGPTCELDLRGRYARAWLAATGRRTGADLAEGEGWELRHGVLRVTRVFKAPTNSRWPRPVVGSELRVARGCLTSSGLPGQAGWPSGVAYCADLSRAPSEESAPDAEQLFLLRPRDGGYWEPVPRYALAGTCASGSSDTPKGFDAVQAWLSASDVLAE